MEGLVDPVGGMLNEWLRDANIIDKTKIHSNNDAALQLCIAAFAMDLVALKYLLYEVGVPVNEPVVEDSSRSALHCVSMVVSGGVCFFPTSITHRSIDFVKYMVSK